jgi:hypothetical protein
VGLAFTRMLAGPMDYTPGGFDKWQNRAVKGDCPTLRARTPRAVQT